MPQLPGFNQIRPATRRRLAIRFSHGAEWKALIMRYIGTIPLSGEAPRHRRAERLRAAAENGGDQRHRREGRGGRKGQPVGGGEARRSLVLASAPGRVHGTGRCHGLAPASEFRNAASPAADTLSHCGSGAASAS